MNNNQIDINSIAVEVIKQQSKEIYADGLKPATKESGEALQAIVGLFNNVVLYPIKMANITFKYKLEQFEVDLRQKNNKIPIDKIMEPPLTIAGPALEALKYTYDTKELREMYLNLLSSAMNMDTVNKTHPAYVEIIKALTPLEAKIFKRLTELKQLPSAQIQIGFEDKVYLAATPKIFVPDLLDLDDAFKISASVENLFRLGLLTYHKDAVITSFNYEIMKEHVFIKNQFSNYEKLSNKTDLIIKMTESFIGENDFGINFAKVCL